jgi:broad specificity phosphatase PhoE
MHTRFLFVRHAACAQTDSILLGRALDAPLDARGQDQARALAENLRHEHPLVLETSPRLRARQTAQAIAAATGLVPRVRSALDEMDFGEWGGRRFDHLALDPRWHHWNARRDRASTPSGATIAGTQALLVHLLDLLSRRFPGATIVLVTHAEIIRSALLHALGAPADDYRRIDVPPASTTAIHVQDGRMFFDANALRIPA